MRFLFAGFFLLSSFCLRAQHFYLFIGTYTLGANNSANGSKGIYVYDFDAATGDMKPLSTAEAENPSYLALSPKGDALYCTDETSGQKPGAVSAFSFDKKTGQLQFLDKQASGGDGPCYVAVDARRKWLMVANYMGGSLAALPIHADGSIGPAAEIIQHTGKSVNPQRQDRPHVHSTTFTPDDHFLIVADLGTDQLSIYRFYPNAPLFPLTSPDDSVVSVKPGSGPRHIAFYPGKPWVYLLDEMGGAIDAFQYNEGKLTPFQHISSHPAEFKGAMGSADIHVAPGGKFLYASNRGDANSIALFSVDTTNGMLTSIGFQSTLGSTPRNFIIDPTGQWLLVANQRTNNVVLFHIDPSTGQLKAEGRPLEIPAPVCLKMLKQD